MISLIQHANREKMKLTELRKCCSVCTFYKNDFKDLAKLYNEATN